MQANRPGLPPETSTLHADHRELLSDLYGIVSDYPYTDPETALAVLADDAAEALGSDTPEGRRERTGYTILLHGTCWYVSARIFSKSLFASYTRALDGFRAQLDRASCTCPDGAHPADLDSEYQVEAGASMLTDAGRAAFAKDYGLGEEELAAFDCEGFLADLADEALGRLHEAHQELFGDIDVSHLDAQFVRDDGRLDIVAMQKAISRNWEHNTGPVALWSARRWLTGQVQDEERLGLFLCLWTGMAQTYGVCRPPTRATWPPRSPPSTWTSPARIRSTLVHRRRHRAVPVPRGGPPVRAGRPPRYPGARRALGPRAVGVPGAVSPVGAEGAGRPQELAHHARRRRRGLGGLSGTGAAAATGTAASCSAASRTGATARGAHHTVGAPRQSP
ncbi:hypothetical protein [Streptomyces erythrochromogenes]|uniref:hypothetical protein n=1 Tax=Streptomyces erythrochromogenes TaxID=285574 RepID=UPI0033C6AA38